jgi:hypothetical protein
MYCSILKFLEETKSETMVVCNLRIGRWFSAMIVCKSGKGAMILDTGILWAGNSSPYRQRGIIHSWKFKVSGPGQQVLSCWRMMLHVTIMRRYQSPQNLERLTQLSIYISIISRFVVWQAFIVYMHIEFSCISEGVFADELSLAQRCDMLFRPSLSQQKISITQHKFWNITYLVT